VTTPATILVVDDELHIRLLLERCLKRSGASVRSVARGDDAVEEIKRGGIGLVVLDYELPGANGLETLRAIRALPEGEHLPAIMLTASGHGAIEAQASELGIARFFGKPFSPSELVRAVADLS
jgi:DNA-binding response OmpR family regulator